MNNDLYKMRGAAFHGMYEPSFRIDVPPTGSDSHNQRTYKALGFRAFLPYQIRKQPPLGQNNGNP